MKTNIIYREEGFLVLEKEKINFDVLIEWFICHLNDYVYVMNDKEFEGIISCKDFENGIRDNKNEINICREFDYINIAEINDRISVYKRFRDDVTLFRLPVFEQGRICGEYYNSITYKENTERYHIKNMIPELTAFKEEIARFFEERGIDKLAVITNSDDDYTNNIIKKLIGINTCFYDSYYLYKNDVDKGRDYQAVLDIKYPDEYRNYYLDKFDIKKNVYIIFDVMSEVLVKCFVEYTRKKKLDLLAVYAVGKDDISYLGANDKNIMSKNKTINDVLIDNEYLKIFYRGNEECYSYATDKELGQLSGRMVRFNGLYNCLMDVRSNKYISVKDGVRETCDNPVKYSKEVHFFGPCIVQGMCVTDNYTIESYLQKRVNEHSPDTIKILNHGSATHTPYASFCNDFLHAMDTQFNEGDTVVIMDAFTERALELLEKNHIPVIMDKSMFDGTENLFLNNPYHCNHLANEMYSNLIFEGLESRGLLSCSKSDNRKEVSSYYVDNNCDLSFRNDAFIFNKELLNYTESLKKYAVDNLKFSRIGGICTQANPFTLGHKALVEFAAKEMDYVYVFVAQDSLSEIQFLERLEIAEDAVSEFDNVKVLPSGTYLSSYRMFPDYFTGTTGKNEFDLTNVWAETRIFAERYCKALGINYRILGEEPNDLYTRLLVEHLEEVLPQYGINTLVIPRTLSEDNQVISASVVRKKLSEKDYADLEKFITPHAIEVLKQYYNNYIND